jgi:intracellular multiplication protein IcmP
MEEKKKDPLIEWMFMGAGAFVLYFVVVWLFGPQITKAWWGYQGAKAQLFSYIWPTNDMLNLVDFAWTEHIWKGVTMKDSWDVANSVNRYWSFPFCIGIGVWAASIAFKNPLKDLVNSYSMKSLTESQANLWPHVKPVLRLNLLKKDPERGPWKSGRTTLEFVEHNGLLVGDSAEIDKEKALRVLSKQLSDVWSGVGHLSPLHRAFFAIFAAQGNWDGREEAPQVYREAKKKAREGINRLAESYHKNQKNLDFEWVDDLMAKHCDHPSVKRITDSHAYVHTVMMSMLEYARLNGVLASSEFFWLRSVDRKMWYTLNNVGRSVAWPEIAGIYGHWLGEKVSESKQIRPYVLKALQALAEAMKNVKLKNNGRTESEKEDSILQGAAQKMSERISFEKKD